MLRIFPALFLLAAIVPAVSAGPDKTGTLSAEEVISRHIQAAGGRDAIARIRSRVAEGTYRMENQPDSRVSIISESPNRVSCIFTFPSSIWTLRYDGKSSGFRPHFRRPYSAVQQKYEEMLASGFMFNSISLYNLLGDSGSNLKAENRGTKKVQGRPAYVIQVKTASTGTLRLYFDTESFMWVRTDFGKTTVAKDPGTFTNDVVSHGEDDTVVDFFFETSDFREVDGVKLPFQFEMTATWPILRRSVVGSVTGRITSYKHNVTIDPKLFE